MYVTNLFLGRHNTHISITLDREPTTDQYTETTKVQLSELSFIEVASRNMDEG